WNTQIDSTELEKLKAKGKGQVLANLGSNVERLIWNRTDPNPLTSDGERSSVKNPHPLLSDLRVRQALSYAIDRNKIVKSLYPESKVATNILVAPDYYVSPNTSYANDLVKARALLDEAGWIDTDGDGIRDKDGIPMKVQVNTTLNPVRSQTLDMVKESFAQIGVELSVNSIEVSKFTS